MAYKCEMGGWCWEGGSRGRGCMYACNWFTSLYSRNQHNVVITLQIYIYIYNWRLLRVPWRARKSNQSILEEINPEYSLEGLMLKPKPQSFGHLMRSTDSLEKTRMLRKTEGRRRRGNRGWDGWMAWLIQWTWVWAASGRQWRRGKSGMLQSMGLQRVRHDLATEQQQQRTIKQCLNCLL